MISLDEWKKQGQFENINNQQIFTRQSGNKNSPVLVLIHGFPSASWDWEGMWKALTEHYYVITLDMLGFGLSDKPKNSSYLITEQADIFQNYLKNLSVEHYHILAHDYGDTVAQELLARQVYSHDSNDQNEPVIDSVCFLNGGLFPEVHKPLFIQKVLLSPLGFLVAKFINKQKFEKNLQRIFGPATQPTHDVIDTLWQLMNHNNGSAVMHRLIHYMPQRNKHRERWVGAIINSNVPVKFINGTKDPISGQNMVNRYREIIPNADVTELPKLGHYPQIEDADATSAAYLQFRDAVL